MKNQAIGKLIGIAGAVVIVILICLPFVSTIKQKTEETELNGAVTNAYTVFLYAEDKNAGLDCDLLFIFNGKVAKVKSNNVRNIEVMTELPKVSRVELGDTLTEGTYTAGTYVRQDESEYYAVNLSADDSLAGLREVSGIYDFDGYRFYGHFEKCDVYIPE